MATQGDEPRMSRVQEKDTLKGFLSNFVKDGVTKYHNILQQISNRTVRKLEVSLDDLREYLEELDSQEGVDKYSPLLKSIRRNTMRYVTLFAEAADEQLASMPSTVHIKADIWDRLQTARQRQIEKNKTDPPPGAAALQDTAAPIDQHKVNNMPAALTRRYDVYIVPEARMPNPTGKEPLAQPVIHMRQVNSEHIGNLVKVKGVITHVTDVKPLASVITYIDRDRGCEIYQEVLGRTFMPLEYSKRADGVKWQNPPQMQQRGSKFIKFQEARLQESSDEVPEGATPRTLRLHLRGEITRSLKAGDAVEVAGVYLPEPFTGWKAMRAGLLTSTFLEVMGVRQTKESYSSVEPTQEMIDKVEELGARGRVFERLAASIAPEIYGMLNVKKALLLQMVGGVTRTFNDGMRLRGDIHICLMGDPGVAKSQLLKHVTKVAPRAVYTTGKGSSGVGLTAAVLRNQVTKELVLEGGALVLADMGICCIDEFDKMEEADRTNIHEVMEQQTVSIAKAGITTTLNTRTAILAAANPAFGRWNMKRPPSENINMPPALLSRFDVVWLLLDKEDKDMDKRLAQHILAIHEGKNPADRDTTNEPDHLETVEPELLRNYIALAKRVEPFIPPGLQEYICSHYVALRHKQKDDESSYITPRTLMSVLRLSQAVAKLRFDNEVSRSDVDAAIELMKESQSSVVPELQQRQQDDPSSRLYVAIRDHAIRSGQEEVPYQQLLNIASRLGLGAVYQDKLNECLHEYDSIGVWTLTKDRQNQNASVRFHQADIGLETQSRHANQR